MKEQQNATKMNVVIYFENFFFLHRILIALKLENLTQKIPKYCAQIYNSFRNHQSLVWSITNNLVMWFCFRCFIMLCWDLSILKFR